MLKNNINDPVWLARLKGAEKFGNDNEEADRFGPCLWWMLLESPSRGYQNTRGGRYVMGIYSDTLHEFWGRITGAMPYGRRKGESFSSGISPGNGFDKNGPTALINSVNRFDFTTIP